MLKRKHKIGFIALIIMMMMVMLAKPSMAADYSCDVSLLGNKTEVKKGEAITILVKVTNIEAGEGIGTFNGTLEYDKNVFDCKVLGDDDGKWQVTAFIENDITMNKTNLEASAEDQTIAKIILTAKSDATAGKYPFKLTKMQFSTGPETFDVSDVSATITIAGESSGGNNSGNQEPGTNQPDNNPGNGSNNGNGSGSTGNGSSQTGGNGSSGSSSGGSSSSSASKTQTNQKQAPTTLLEESSSENSIPKTGIEDILIAGVIIGIIAAVVFYIKYKRAY